jgi:hypothetical protein
VKALFDAIELAYADTALDTATTGIYHVYAPVTVKMPYVTYLLLGNIPDRTNRSGGLQVCENARLQISVWTPGFDSADCLALYSLLTAVYDDAVLTVAGYHHIQMTRASDNLVADPEGGWQYAVEYEVSIQEV